MNRPKTHNLNPSETRFGRKFQTRRQAFTFTKLHLTLLKKTWDGALGKGTAAFFVPRLLMLHVCLIWCVLYCEENSTSYELKFRCIFLKFIFCVDDCITFICSLCWITVFLYGNAHIKCITTVFSWK